MLISDITPLDPAAQEAFLSLFSDVRFKKGTAFAKRGEISKHIAYVQDGVLRAYFSKNDGEQYNKTFFKQGDFVGAFSSLVTGSTNLIDIDCLTDCVVKVASYQQIRNLYDQHPTIERLARILAEQFFVVKEKREIELVTLDAKDRYAIFLNEHPGLDQLIPQYHIASYLGVSPTQLSRIRAQKSKSLPM